jgi:hypothetical protein
LALRSIAASLVEQPTPVEQQVDGAVRHLFTSSAGRQTDIHYLASPKFADKISETEIANQVGTPSDIGAASPTIGCAERRGMPE